MRTGLRVGRSVVDVAVAAVALAVGLHQVVFDPARPRRITRRVISEDVPISESTPGRRYVGIWEKPPNTDIRWS